MPVSTCSGVYHHLLTGRGSGGWRKLLVISALLATSLLGCKIEIIVPPEGKVTASDGSECLAGQRCVIDVTDVSFDRTFTAVPAAGYIFSHWRRVPSALCGDFATPCRLKTAGFDSFPQLMEVLESDAVYYLEPVFTDLDRDYWAKTVAEIEDETFSTDDFLYAVRPNVSMCDPGSLTRGARDRVLLAVNKVRALHGLPAADYDDFYDMQVQEASLVQAANNYLSHFPDPGDSCYSESGAIGARTSNISGGPQGDPAQYVFGWTNDNNNVAELAAAGHRRWILFPGLGYVSYGQVTGSAALKVFDFGQPPVRPVPQDLEFVAMPYQIYPYILVSSGAKPTPWSLSIVPPANGSSDFDYFRDAQVTVAWAANGEELPVHSLHTDTQGFGLANFLSWMVDDWQYDRTYTVTVRNIRMPGGASRDIEYWVLMDRFNLLDLNEPLEAGDSALATRLDGRFNSPKDKDSYDVSLEGSVSFRGQSNFSNQAFFILLYDKRKRLIQSSDEAFTVDLKRGRYTIVVSPCNESGLCFQNVQTYAVTFD